tara:strand:- start:186 stop:485 length:300 start_codon:yes stop_codon:yes gene_type:complete
MKLNSSMGAGQSFANNQFNNSDVVAGCNDWAICMRVISDRMSQIGSSYADKYFDSHIHITKPKAKRSKAWDTDGTICHRSCSLLGFGLVMDRICQLIYG